MKQDSSRNAYRVRRHIRLRKRVVGTAERPRLSVFRSLRDMYAQFIDDERSLTILGVSTNSAAELTGDAGARTGKAKAAYLLGLLAATKAKEKNITQVVFDRGGFTYHGRIAAFADGARDGGLQF